MAERKTIYLPDHAAEYLAAAASLSGRVTAIVLRYRELCRRHLPALTRAQWCAVIDANNGTDDLLLGGSPESVGMMLWANVADTPGLGEKWGVDVDDLMHTMRAWSYAEQVAAFESLRTFWGAHQRPTDEALRLAGMIA